MELSQDLRELLESFVSRNVDFIVVGAHALAYHGVPRFTGDLDLLINPKRENAERVLEALESFGFAGLGLATEDFTAPDQVIQLGNPPSRVDILTSISGVSWEEARRGAVSGELGTIAVSYLGRKDLIRNKKSTGRAQDMADLERLGE